MTWLYDLLLGLPPALILAAAFLLPAVEASALVGLIVPGETAVFVAGLTSHSGHLPLAAVAVVAAAGAVIGDQVGFTLGRRWGPVLLRRLPQRLASSGRVDRAVALVRERGAWAVLLGRWTALLRALVPGLAGASGMDRKRFTLANLVGGSVWAAAVAVLGYLAGSAYQQVAGVLGRSGEIVVGAVLLAVLTATVVRRIRRRRTRRDTIDVRT